MHHITLMRVKAVLFSLTACSMLFGQSPTQIPSGTYWIAEFPQEPVIAEAIEISEEQYYEFPVITKDPDTNLTEQINEMSLQCIEKLNDPNAYFWHDGKQCVNTGFKINYEMALKIYAQMRINYYGNIFCSMAYTRQADGNVELYLIPNYGTPEQAYTQHCAAKSELKKIAAGFTGTEEEKTEQIFKWMTDNISYADQASIDRVKGLTDKSRLDYNGICASTYSAVFDRKSICDGSSNMMLALLSMNGISAAKIWNDEHAFIAKLYENDVIIYDPTNNRKESFSNLYNKYNGIYQGTHITLGYIIKQPDSPMPNTYLLSRTESPR